MYKVSLVGHSQVPQTFNVNKVEIKIFRAPGGHASSFFSDNRLNSVLSWKHDLCILWIGSNDISQETDIEILFNDLKEIVNNIERECGALVTICQIEPRIYSDNGPISTPDYVKIQRAVNKKIKRSLRNPTINFNTKTYIEHLSSDGVHWNSEGRRLVENKLLTAIENNMDSDSDDQ